MTPERWQEVKSVFHQALELAPDERSAFLDHACPTDHSLRREVESLLSSDEEARSSFLQSASEPRSTLTNGTRVGDFEILSLLGAGGMGEVYRARDRRLERDVAIKVLPRFISFDPERLRRFEQEAKAAAALNHPNILAVFQMGTYEDAPYLVSELLEGETLREQVKRGAIPLKKAIDYGVQIAYGLAAAHERGIVHRDLKPENLFVTRDGRIKILDFGLAKLVQPESDTRLAKQSVDTEPGMVLGTVGYMAPEQIEGKELDGRSDIFSLGAVLYEMMIGKRAFEGKSQLSVVSAILERDPAPVSSIKPLTPSGLDHAIRRCLAKDPDERWQTARDLAMELKWIDEETSQTAVSMMPRTRRSRQWLVWAVAATVAALAVAGFLTYQRLTTPPPVVVSDIGPPKGTQFSFLVNGPPALSPDGRAVVFSALDATGKASLWVRQLDGSPAQPIPGTEDADQPFWSPDNERIGFLIHEKLIIFELSNGPAVTLTDDVGRSGSWSRAGTILFGRPSGIYKVSASGGPAALVLPRDASKYALIFSPVFLPDGRHFLYAAANGSSGDIFFASLDGKQNRLLLRGTSQAVYASGFLLYVRAATLVAQPFDPEAGKLTGTPRPIAEQVQQTVSAEFSFAASENGTLIYEPGAPSRTQLASFDRSGKRLAFIDVPELDYDLRLSPDARRLAFAAGSPKSEIWADDLDRNVRMRLTFDPDTDHGLPVWSPDGRTLLFSTLRDSKGGVGIFRKASDGRGSGQLLLPSDRPDREVWATDWSRDGRFLLLLRGDMGHHQGADIWVLPLTGEKKPTLFLQAPAETTFDAKFSPDGRWVAYESRESGRREVYVVSFDPSKFLSGSIASKAPGGKWQISSDGGEQPRWRRDGKELFYFGRDHTIIAVETEGKGATFELGRSQRLFTAPFNPVEWMYDVSPDGQRFVICATLEQEEAPLVLISNWPARLQSK